MPKKYGLKCLNVQDIYGNIYEHPMVNLYMPVKPGHDQAFNGKCVYAWYSLAISKHSMVNVYMPGTTWPYLSIQW